MPQIAVIIPMYNAEKSILKTIKSLENQSFDNWLAVVVDDGSTDESIAVLKSLNSKKIEIIVLEKNCGRGFARQVALDKVRSLQIPYMCMLDADDFYFPDKLKFQHNFMEQNLDVTLLSSAMTLLDKNNNLYRVIRPFDTETTFYFDSFINFVQLPHASSIIRIKDIDKVNYDVSFRYSEDLDFLRRILFKKKYAFTPEIHYGYQRDDSFSFNKYLKSTSFNIKSFNKLEINPIQKAKYLATSVLKSGVVFILSIFALEKLYLSKVGQKPRPDDYNKFNDFKRKSF